MYGVTQWLLPRRFGDRRCDAASNQECEGGMMRAWKLARCYFRFEDGGWVRDADVSAVAGEGFEAGGGVG